MPRCPNCFYELVLLEHKRKYKCAKCGRLFPQKEIDDKEFREWNKKEKDKLWRKIYKRRISKKEARKRNKEAWKKWWQKNKEKILAKEKELRLERQKKKNEELY